MGDPMHINRFLFEITCRNTLGKNVLWHEQEQALYWTDTKEKLLYKCAMSAEVVSILTADPANIQNARQKDDYLQQVLQVFDLPHRLGSFAFTNRSNTLLAGFENGLAIYNYTTKQLEWQSQTETGANNVRFNDGKADSSGCYWLGSTIEQHSNDESVTKQSLQKHTIQSHAQEKNKQQEHGTLYRFSLENGKFHAQEALSSLRISNSLCFNQSPSVMYHADSSTHKVQQHTLDENGHIISSKLFAKFDKHILPYGACTDKHSNVWIALWGGACVVCFNAKGRELFRHPLPVTQGACVSIGGPNMNWLFVSSAAYNLSEEKLTKQTRAGNVFVYEISESLGLSEPCITID